MGYSVSPILLRVEKAKLLNFARLFEVVLHASSWLLVSPALCSHIRSTQSVCTPCVELATMIRLLSVIELQECKKFVRTLAKSGPSIQVESSAHRRCPLPRPPFPLPATFIPLLPATAAGHPWHLPSLAARTKSCRCSPAAPAFWSQPLPPPLSSSLIAVKALTGAAAASSSAFSSLCRSLCRTPLPPSLPSRFYRNQALLCRSLDLLFFITVGQLLPSSLAVTTTPLCSARTLLCRCSYRNLLGRALLCHRGTLVPSSFPVAAIAPKCRPCPSSVPPLRFSRRRCLILNHCLQLSALLQHHCLLLCHCYPRCHNRFQPHPYRCTSLLPPLHLAATAAPPCCISNKKEHRHYLFN
ncbi:hypothetical protein BHM03_00046858 [Ensete ventricosum]|nr:hypothetical protein BHM03_00046858 [Ensete ventricosum]